jgi:hypothetical protein
MLPWADSTGTAVHFTSMTAPGMRAGAGGNVGQRRRALRLTCATHVPGSRRPTLVLSSFCHALDERCAGVTVLRPSAGPLGAYARFSVQVGLVFCADPAFFVGVL